MRQPVLVEPAGRMPFFNRLYPDCADEPLRPSGPSFYFFFRRTCFMRVSAEWLDSVNSMIYEMSATGHCDPGITGGDHMSAGVESKNQHCEPTENHRPAGKSRTIFNFQFSIFDFQIPISNFRLLFLIFQSAFGNRKSTILLT